MFRKILVSIERQRVGQNNTNDHDVDSRSFVRNGNYKTENTEFFLNNRDDKIRSIFQKISSVDGTNRLATDRRSQWNDARKDR